MANNDVIVDTAIDGSDTGNVIIEGVKYFPQKKEIYSKDDYENILWSGLRPILIHTDWAPRISSMKTGVTFLVSIVIRLPGLNF